LGQRSRKRGRRNRPATATRPAPTAGAASPPRASRSEARNEAIRAGLTPFAAGERPWAIRIGAALSLLIGVGNLVAWVAGVKIAGKHPAAGGIVVFAGLMIVCAVGLWRMWYGAVLAFMGLLAIIVTLFTLLLIEASNALGFVVAPVVIIGCGYLFIKLVRTLSRIQMPRYPGR
jgi:hypothetical protein